MENRVNDFGRVGSRVSVTDLVCDRVFLVFLNARSLLLLLGREYATLESEVAVVLN